MPKTPYVHNFTAELEVMPILARGSNAAIFHTIGLLLPTSENGATENEIAKYTGLSLKTVQSTLANLLQAGLIAKQGDNYTVTKYIEYRKVERKFPQQGDSLSISNQSQNLNQAFAKALQELSGMLLLSGGISAADIQDFNELWTDYPDAETHARAIAITLEKAGRPNYKYYRAVVQSGAHKVEAKPYPTKREQFTRPKPQAAEWQPPTPDEIARFRAERAAMRGAD